MSYFELKCKDFTSRPFATTREKEEFATPLERWESYCQSHDRTPYYHIPAKEVLDLQSIIKGAIGILPIHSLGSKKQIVLSNVVVQAAKVDAVVNAANETLLGGGGVDAAIHDGAGSNLVRECATLGGCNVGEAKTTKGYDLPATYVIHTVAPIFDEEEKPQPDLLEKCYLASLIAAEKIKLRSIVFPCLGCGFYGFPVDQSAHVVFAAVQKYLRESSGSIETVVFSLFDDNQKTCYEKELAFY